MTKVSNKHRRRAKLHNAAVYQCELEVAEGLEQIAADELIAQFRPFVDEPMQINREAVKFNYRGELKHLLGLKTVVSAYLVQHFAVPRPRALLGHEHFERLMGGINAVQALWPARTFTTFYIGAAGAESSVMLRLKEEMALHTGLRHSDDAGDLLLRLKRSGNGWDVLLRLSPRPLSARAWRVCNFEGALNAPVAQAMILLTNPRPSDTVLNITSGSGTLLIERLIHSPARITLGCDIDPNALICGENNIKAAGLLSNSIRLIRADATKLPVPDSSVDVICGDLPFGQLIGSHDKNMQLYPALLKEAARVARRDARCVFITHEIRMMTKLLETSSAWRIENMLQVSLRGLHPCIFLLSRN